jgi:uncharacterized protein (TIGR00661 family)
LLQKTEINPDQAVLTGKIQKKPRILVAPLDWGLGHATRCIPLIRELIQQDADVWIAAERSQESLLRAEFPHLNFLPLAGYRAKYARSGLATTWQILLQTRRFLKTIKNENAWLSSVVEKYHFDAVISDNRFGLYHHSIPCIFMTHQLSIKTAFGKWSESLLRNRNYRYIQKFRECWVPDQESLKDALAGDLSHPGQLPKVPVRYLGTLSRFDLENIPVEKDHLLFILSGPEPQRSILENKIVDQVAHYQGTATIVRALPGNSSIIPSTNTIRFYNHLSSSELNTEMARADYIISRSGYSTVMDLAVMHKKSILIPTPGQTEQEYLARILHEKKMAYTVSQAAFSLESSLINAKVFNYRLPVVNKNEIGSVIRKLLSGI